MWSAILQDRLGDEDAADLGLFSTKERAMARVELVVAELREVEHGLIFREDDAGKLAVISPVDTRPCSCVIEEPATD